MNAKIKTLNEVAYRRIADGVSLGINKNSHIRLKDELQIIEKTHTEDYFLSFIKIADEARTAGDFYAIGSANCSLLLYYAGATTINPLWFNTPFERFINNYNIEHGVTPYYEISREKIFTDEQPYDTPLNDIVFERAMATGLIESNLKEIAKKYPPASSYQFTNDVLCESNGVIVWQEQVMELLHRMGGFSYETANDLRREGGKGLWLDKTWHEEKRKIFLQNALCCGYDYYFADKYFRYIFDANIYTRLKAHVAATVLF